jgi:uncharacterized protein (DUF2267 family)
MDYAKFVKEVKMRTNTKSEDEALKAIKAVLESLSEHLSGEEPGHLASQLPQAIGKYLKTPGGSKRFTPDDFYRMVEEKEKVDRETATHHTRGIMEVLRLAVSRGEVEHIKAQLPEEFYEILNLDHQ